MAHICLILILGLQKKDTQPTEKDCRKIRVIPVKWNSKGDSYVQSGPNKENSKQQMDRSSKKTQQTNEQKKNQTNKTPHQKQNPE